ncbi:AsmA family protein [Vibrio hangzhouensis]|uniref:AsmA family protein n=1 Tax=Vibrio hangzhouensis TaxID=462991 RepID=UPI001C944B4E|nr:AsmA family protein [Vibrio hangzhouensis]MBY6198343.1 AsmA family protein [Vibrio hangzhouensis]
MKKALLTIIAMFIGFVTMMFSLLLAIPLTIAAFFTGKRIKKQLDQELAQHQQAMNGNTIEGEYEEVSSR